MTIRQVIEKSDLTKVEIAKQLGLTRQHLDSIINAKDCKLSILRKLCIILNCNLEDLIADELNRNREYICGTSYSQNNKRYYVEIYRDK